MSVVGTAPDPPKEIWTRSLSELDSPYALEDAVEQAGRVVMAGPLDLSLIDLQHAPRADGEVQSSPISGRLRQRRSLGFMVASFSLE